MQEEQSSAEQRRIIDLGAGGVRGTGRGGGPVGEEAGASSNRGLRGAAISAARVPPPSTWAHRSTDISPATGVGTGVTVVAKAPAAEGGVHDARRI
eukprot:9466328-Pyramimonas_sp.AAC.1